MLRKQLESLFLLGIFVANLMLPGLAWAAGVVPDVTAFEIPATSDSLMVSITTFTATDDVAVVGYLLTEVDIQPAFDDPAWIEVAPATFTFAAGGSKTLYAWVKDANNNVSNSLSDNVTITLADTTPPVLSLGAPSGTLDASTNSVDVSFATNENAYCKYALVAGTAFDVMVDEFTTTGGTTHRMTKNVLATTSYAYFVRCQDAYNNDNSSDYQITFSVAAAPAVVPTISPTDTDTSKSSSKKKKKKKKKSSGSCAIANSSSTVSQGAVLTQRGSKFSPNSPVLLYFAKAGGGFYPPQRVMTSSAGTFAVAFRANKPAGSYSWYAVDTKTGKRSRTATYKVK